MFLSRLERDAVTSLTLPSSVRITLVITYLLPLFLRLLNSTNLHLLLIRLFPLSVYVCIIAPYPYWTFNYHVKIAPCDGCDPLTAHDLIYATITAFLCHRNDGSLAEPSIYIFSFYLSIKLKFHRDF